MSDKVIRLLGLSNTTTALYLRFESKISFLRILEFQPFNYVAQKIRKHKILRSEYLMSREQT